MFKHGRGTGTSVGCFPALFMFLSSSLPCLLPCQTFDSSGADTSIRSSSSNPHPVRTSEASGIMPRQPDLKTLKFWCLLCCRSGCRSRNAVATTYFLTLTCQPFQYYHYTISQPHSLSAYT
ncbi:hypothetical protein BGW80DRAFT_1308345 [Lactifluus volemus]|nr:hypothetical protein BGW80DRAFT_1308345 [Lactifluus volemus]